MENRTFGSRFAVGVSLLTIATFTVAILTPPLSGPWCTAGCFAYPFDGIESRFPRDYWWMYLASLVSIAFIVLMAFVREWAPAGKKLCGTLGLAFGSMAALVLLADYYVQLFVVQPSLINGETDGIALISQYNAHGVFIALENLGYFLMSLAMACAAPVFEGKGKRRALRWTLAGSLALNIAALAWITLAFGNAQEYRFEIATISIGWLALIVSGFLLGSIFKEGGQAAAPGNRESR